MGKHRGVDTGEKEKEKQREGKEALSWGWGQRGEKKEKMVPLMSVYLSFTCPWLALVPQVGTKNIHLLGWGPTGCWLNLSHLWELSLTWAGEMEHARDSRPSLEV